MAESCYDVLQTIVEEFETLSPETTSVLVFDGEGHIIATSKAIPEDQKHNLLTTFDSINGLANAIGGLENLNIQTSTGQLYLSAIAPLFLVSISSRKANPKVLKSLIHVIIPTMVSLINKIVEFPIKTEEYQLLNPREIEEPALVSDEKPEIETFPELDSPFETVAQETLGSQLIVEKISDFLVSADTVRIDGEVVAKWFRLAGGKKIRLITIETSEGRTTICKFKPMDELFKRKFGVAAVTIRRKEAKSSTKGIIQVPEKILLALQTDKGKLVRVRPVIDQFEE